MASSRDYLEFVLERLSAVCDDVSYRPMLGEFLVYKDGVYFGGVFDNRFLVKKTVGNARFESEEQLPYDGAKLMYMIDDSVDSETLAEIIEITVNDLKTTKKTKK